MGILILKETVFLKPALLLWIGRRDRIQMHKDFSYGSSGGYDRNAIRSQVTAADIS